MKSFISILTLLFYVNLFGAISSPPLPNAPGDGWMLTSINGVAVWTRDAGSLTNIAASSGASIDYVNAVSNSLYLQLVAATNALNAILAQQRIDSTNAVWITSKPGSVDLTASTNALWLTGKPTANDLVAATNQIWLTSKPSAADLTASTNASWITSKASLADLASATNNALALATNNDLLISQSATNHDTIVSNGVVTLAIGLTNAFDTIVDVNGKTNLLDTIADVNAKTNLLDTIVDVTAKLASATNNALVLATNNDLLISQSATNQGIVVSNGIVALGYDTVSSVNAKLVSATNNALALATNNDRLISQSATNQGIVISNGVISALGTAAFTASSAYDAAGAGTTAATIATNNITSALIQGKFPSAILTNNGSFAVTWSNVFTADAAHYLAGIASFSAITNTGLTSADAIATDSNGKEVGASAILMTHISQPGPIVTNGNSFALTISNNTIVDASHTLTAAGGATLGTATISSGGNLAAANIAWTGTNAGNSTGSTNNQVAAQSANYNILLSDSFIPLNGSRTATLPTAVGISGREFTIWCATSGTNAILTTSSQTIDGFTKWTNLSQFSVVTVKSDGSNWRVVSTKP